MPVEILTRILLTKTTVDRLITYREPTQCSGKGRCTRCEDVYTVVVEEVELLATNYY